MVTDLTTVQPDFIFIFLAALRLVHGYKVEGKRCEVQSSTKKSCFYCFSLPLCLHAVLRGVASVLKVLLGDVMEVFRHRPEADVGPEQAQGRLGAAGRPPGVFGSSGFVQRVPVLHQLMRQRERGRRVQTTLYMREVKLKQTFTCSTAGSWAGSGSVDDMASRSFANFFWENSRKAPGTENTVKSKFMEKNKIKIEQQSKHFFVLDIYTSARTRQLPLCFPTLDGCEVAGCSVRVQMGQNAVQVLWPPDDLRRNRTHRQRKF